MGWLEFMSDCPLRSVSWRVNNSSASKPTATPVATAVPPNSRVKRARVVCSQRDTEEVRRMESGSAGC